MKKTLFNNKIKMISISAAVIVGIISLLAIMNAYFSEKDLEIVNYDQVETNLSRKEKDELEKSIYRTLKNGELIDSNETGIKAMIRNSSYSEERKDSAIHYNFLVDIDNPKVTYRIEFALVDKQGFYEAPIIECPDIELMKYPEINCVGGRTSTMSITIGKYLPYYFHLSTGQFVTITSAFDKNNPNNLNIRVSSCGDKAIIEETNKKVQEWIMELGYEPEKYNINIPEYCDGSMD